MLAFGFVLVIYPGLFYCDPDCVTSDQVVDNPRAPSLEIRTIPDDSKVMLIAGHNFSVVCTSNSSKEYEFEKEETMPIQITMFYGPDLKQACGSEDDVKKDTLTCIWNIPNATVEKSGNYTCMVSNDLKCTVITTLVIVKEPSAPKVTIYPAEGNMMVAFGSYFNLSCITTGAPPPKITWLRDGRQIMSNSSITDVSGTTSVIIFKPVRPENRGRYWCEANNTEGWVQSSAIFLRVLWRPFFVSQPEDVSTDEGENITLFCSASGFPTPKIGWLKDNVSISNVSVGENSSLVLHFVKRETVDGKYRCVAENSLGRTFSLEITLIVLPGQTARGNTNSKTGVLDAVWACLGAVAAILLLSTALVFIRKYWRARHNSRDGRNSFTTGYTRC